MMADDTAAVLEHAGIEKARVAGISMGGAIAQEFALRYPDKVQSLVLVSTWPKFNNYAKTVYENLKKMRVQCKPEDFTELVQLWIYAPPYYEKHLENLKEGQRNAALNQNPQTREGFEGQLDACINHDTVDRLYQIKVPTLITVGEMDIFTPPEYSEILYSRIPVSEYVKFPRAGHVHHWEELEWFNQVTTNFLLKN
jgi:pimeloyl-ACP methyl ester carboxylesterase